MSYGCTVFNRFAIGDDEEEEDPFEALAKLEEKKKEEKEKSTQKSKETKEAKNKATKKAADESIGEKKSLGAQNKAEDSREGSAKPKDKEASRGGVGGVGGGRGRGRGGVAPSNQENQPPSDVNGPPPRRGGFRGGDATPAPAPEGGDSAPRGRGGFRGGRGGPRGGGRGGRGGGVGGPREFDRQSADPKSSVRGTDKREGGGRGNWGSDKDVIDDQLQAATAGDAVAVEDAAPVPAPAEGESTAEAPKPAEGEAPASEAAGEPEEAKEPEPVEMTLDEWKALQLQEKAKPAFQIRKAGEGVDNQQWGEMVALKKKNDDSSDDEEEESEEEDSEEEEQREKTKRRNKQVLDIRFEFAGDEQRGGRGRGGFRGGRGGGFRGGRGRDGVRGAVRGVGGRGGGRGGVGGGAPREADVLLDDPNQFPSLGGSRVAEAADA